MIMDIPDKGIGSNIEQVFQLSWDLLDIADFVYNGNKNQWYYDIMKLVIWCKTNIRDVYLYNNTITYKYYYIIIVLHNNPIIKYIDFSQFIPFRNRFCATKTKELLSLM